MVPLRRIPRLGFMIPLPEWGGFINGENAHFTYWEFQWRKMVNDFYHVYGELSLN